MKKNHYIEQNKGSKLFFDKNSGEPKVNLFMSYPDMKTKYLIGIIDLRHQPDHKTPGKSQIFKEYGANPDFARLF